MSRPPPGIPALWRSARLPLALAALVILVAVGTALSRGAPARRLDPESAAKVGSRALAVVLRDRGVDVERVGSPSELAGRPGVATTLFVPFPDRLGPDGLGRVAALGAEQLVLVAPRQDVLDRLVPGVRVGASVSTRAREPVCELPQARRAGVADAGGTTYTAVPQAVLVSCYASGGEGSVVVVESDPTATPAGRTVTVVGDGTAFTNARLGEVGNAALALGLLGRAERVLWLMPPPGPDLAAAGDPKKPVALQTLLPSRLSLALVQLAVAVVLIALWRGRRLGPVISEPLPVIVRAAEAVEGRGRLYRAARSRDRAADALRSGIRSRLLPPLGLPPDATPASVVESVAERTRRPAGAVAGLLYGAAPADDAALVALADDLDALDREVRRS
ncbi:MAG: DUF4350 domain-containing protein [Mycobacteriales bacterium]